MKVKRVEFISPLQLQACAGDAEWDLLSDFRVRITTDMGTWVETVLKGFRTDLSSVPRLPLMFLMFGGRARKPGVIHDWLYTRGQGDRSFADQVFFVAMGQDQNWATRTAMWLGARVGGWAFWQRRKVPTLPA